MSYTPTEWENGTTPINATNLNKIEKGISDNDTAISNNYTLIIANSNNISTNASNITTNTSSITALTTAMNKILPAAGLTVDLSTSVSGYSAYATADTFWLTSPLVEFYSQFYNTIEIVSVPNYLTINWDGKNYQETIKTIEVKDKSLCVTTAGNTGNWQGYTIGGFFSSTIQLKISSRKF